VPQTDPALSLVGARGGNPTWSARGRAGDRRTAEKSRQPCAPTTGEDHASAPRGLARRPAPKSGPTRLALRTAIPAKRSDSFPWITRLEGE